MKKGGCKPRCSSSDEYDDEYIRWREVLRNQIEKELDYQVGMRLGRSGQLIIRPLSSGHQIMREILPLSTRHPHHRLRERSLNTHTSSNSLESSPILSLHCSLESSPIMQWSGPNHEQPTSNPAQVYAPSTAGNEQTKESIPLLFNYVSSKYGTPVNQLQHLSASGSFKSTDMESSGGGPILRFPPEANITLPTPTHSVNSSSTAFPLRSSVESSLVSTAINPGHESGHNLETEASCGYSHGQVIPTLSLQFESCFEGGNLQQATAIGPHEYELVLRPDLYCKRHMQWFYFRVQGMQQGVPYHFHIVNLQKPDSLYNHGMQPLLYSEKEAEQGWTRVGYNVSYSKNCNPSLAASNDRELFTLSWTMEFPHSDDQCYLAHCFPYPFSKLLQYINQLELSSTMALRLQCQQLCKTLAGNTCPLLTITDFQDVSNMSDRAGVLVSARVHPGESNSSWMMQGFINWLTSDASHANVLRSHFVFKVIPMLNPDGVIVGNSRTSLAGVDLNRIYKKPRKDLFPTIFHAKALLRSFMQEREVVLYIDLHGHSRKQNVFTYGCGSNRGDHNQFLNERIFPFLLSRQLPNMFCLNSCKYSVQRCKESTGRVVAWRMGLNDAFTLESTFCGSTLGQSPSWQFCERDLEDIGCGLGEAIYRYHRMLKNKSYKQKVLSELAEILLKKQDSLTRDVGLPDLVQSTVYQHRSDRTTAHREGRDNQAKTKPGSTKRTSAIREFMKCDLSLLDVESSTTGSDSENDEFEYQEAKKKQTKSKRHRKGRRHHMQRSTTLPSLQQHSSITTSIHTTEVSSGPKSTASSISELAWKGRGGSRNSEACGNRDQQTSSKQHAWRFVNRYAHRSNGGIPIFSEERLQERAKKHQSLTSSQTPTDQNQRAQLLWQPEDSSVRIGMAGDEKQSGGSAPSYMRVGGASEQGKSGMEKVAMITTTAGTVRDPVHISTRRTERMRAALLKLGNVDQTTASKRRGTHLGYGFTRQPTLELPTHLAKYISEIWKSSIQ